MRVITVLCVLLNLCVNLLFPDVSDVTPLLFSKADISSLEIAFLKAVMLPPEIEGFCAAVCFNSQASFKIPVIQPNQTSLLYVTNLP